MDPMRWETEEEACQGWGLGFAVVACVQTPGYKSLRQLYLHGFFKMLMRAPCSEQGHTWGPSSGCSG